MVAKLSDQAVATRARAKRARRLAGTLTVAVEVDRRYAEELEVQAVDLEWRAKDCG